ncbi:F-box domain-containing protein [Hirschfeldia incana]|nr:F-box domain-containing protein [Hirschfeldia incana]
MEIPDPGRWSDLPVDILGSLLERLSFIDFHRAKTVCSNWYLCSKQTLGPKDRSPLLLLSPEEGGCLLYNPEEDRVYVPRRDFSGCRFLGNSGKWFLVADSQSNLYIVDVFSDEKIDLPRLELVSDEGCVHNLEPLGDDGDFVENLVGGNFNGSRKPAEDLRGRVWVDEKTGDYVVVCRFDRCDYMRFCKKGDDRYREIQTRVGVTVMLKGQADMVLSGYNLYVFTPRCSLRQIDLSGKDGFEDVTKQPMYTWYKPYPSAEEEERMRAYKYISESYNIAVTRSGEVLLVHNYTYESTTTFEKHRMFRVYKRQLKNLEDPETYKPRLVEVDSLGDEALFLDLGITVPADTTLGIEPNSIYFTRDDRFRLMPLSFLDICVYNLATKNINRFPTLSSNLEKIKDAQWFIPS